MKPIDKVAIKVAILIVFALVLIFYTMIFSYAWFAGYFIPGTIIFVDDFHYNDLMSAIVAIPVVMGVFGLLIYILLCYGQKY